MSTSEVFFVAAKRTPIGAFQGALAALTAPQLGAVAIRAALQAARLPAESVDLVVMGNVLSAGLGQAPARQASRAAAIPDQVPSVTINKVCGSGLEAILAGARAIALGEAHVVVAGGMESMSNVPYYLPTARKGQRLGHGKMIDGVIHDGLWDPYHDFHMGTAGELCAREYKFDRETQDAYATRSYRLALEAQAQNAWNDELAPVEVPVKGGSQKVTLDEEPGRGNLEKFASLKPAFDPKGTITAANASSINDGAAAVILASRAAVERHELVPLAKLVGHGAAAKAPEWFTTAPVPAIHKALERSKLQLSDIDLFELNEAFAVVPLAAIHELGIEQAKVNVHGGAIALGHPIGASGARITVTLIHALRRQNARRGVAALCIGGGEGLAAVLERT